MDLALSFDYSPRSSQPSIAALKLDHGVGKSIVYGERILAIKPPKGRGNSLFSMPFCNGLLCFNPLPQ